MIRVLVADDHPEFRGVIASILAREPDISVCAQAADGRQAVVMARQLLPDVVLMDVAMPNLDGIAATAELVGSGLSAKVLIFTADHRRDVGSRGLAAGAVGCLVKGCAVDALLAAIRGCVGGAVLDEV